MKVELTPQQAQTTHTLCDIAIRARGAEVAGAALAIMSIMEEAIAEDAKPEEPEPEEPAEK